VQVYPVKAYRNKQNEKGRITAENGQKEKQWRRKVRTKGDRKIVHLAIVRKRRRYQEPKDGKTLESQDSEDLKRCGKRKI